jgi:carbon-monoxide dehydrogenase medium subunit
MIPSAFEYTRPGTVDDAISALAAAGEDAKILGGGQSLIPVLRLRLAAPSVLVDLGGIEELTGVREDGDAIVIGAMTTHDAVLRDELVRRYAPLVAQATATVGDRQVRHLGTFGGSLAHADPAADLPAVALALDAEFVIAGSAGRRAVPAAEFFVDYLTTAVGADEVLVEVRLPKLDGWRVHYEKFSRLAQAWAIVGVAAAVQRDNGTITGARVALTNMGSTPIRASAVESALVGQPANEESYRAAAAAVTDGTRASDDLNGSAEYREHLAGVLTRRALAAVS